ncbi:MAG: hypothetical protein E7213_08215 [Clostridium sp.]|jgi:hypothetical protein|nr:hypothetical protein [Clostridium sp.]
MISIKLEKNKKNEPVFKLNAKEEDIEKNRVLKRVLFESKKIKGMYGYNVPMRFFQIVLKIIPKDDIKIDKRSIDFYFEFADDYEEKYYYVTEVNATYMKKWREEGCPEIFKINIDKDEKDLKKEVAFKRVLKLNI